MVAELEAIRVVVTRAKKGMVSKRIHPNVRSRCNIKLRGLDDVNNINSGRNSKGLIFLHMIFQGFLMWMLIFFQTAGSLNGCTVDFKVFCNYVLNASLGIKCTNNNFTRLSPCDELLHGGHTWGFHQSSIHGLSHGNTKWDVHKSHVCFSFSFPHFACRVSLENSPAFFRATKNYCATIDRVCEVEGASFFLWQCDASYDSHN